MASREKFLFTCQALSHTWKSFGPAAKRVILREILPVGLSQAAIKDVRNFRKIIP